MKRYLLVSLFISVAGLLASCEKVVNTSLNTAAPRYVIEGFITNEDTCRIRLSRTRNFSDSNQFRGVAGAAVYVSDNGSTPFLLPEVKEGVYETLQLKGIPGHTYHLTVAIGEFRFTASCQMPALVPLDSLFISRISYVGKNWNVANVLYNDPLEQVNYYNFVEYVNREEMADVFVNSDNLSNGRQVQFSLYTPTELQVNDNINAGDTVRVEMQCIDAAIYKFWYSLNAGASGSGVLATPANPESNISGGALGYFSAHTVQSKVVVVF